MRKRYVGNKTLVERGTVCDVEFSYNPGFKEYMAIAVIPPYNKRTTLYYSSPEDRDAEWEDVGE